MAKKSATKKPKKKAATKTAPTKAAPTKAAAAKAKPADTRPAIDDGVIGHAAGGVWALLHDAGPQTVPAIKKAVGAPADAVLMAIGWLAREGKLDFHAGGRSLKVALR